VRRGLASGYVPCGSVVRIRPEGAEWVAINPTRTDHRRGAETGWHRVRAEGPIWQKLGTVACTAELLYCWCAPQMEDAMCYAKDYKVFDDQKKAEDTRVVQERRAGLIDRLLNDANKHGEKTKTEGLPVKEAAPAK
jgi:hypothetical protein